MTTMVARSSLTPPRPSTISPDELAGIARTFEDSDQAVWVHDLSGRCLYRNQAAYQTAPNPGRDTPHDVLDHQARPVAQLRLRMG